jgi:TolA-binding protein
MIRSRFDCLFSWPSRPAIQFKPDYYPALFNMGLLCLEQGRVREAAGWYRQASATKPASKDALFQLGSALRTLGQLEAGRVLRTNT